MTKDKDIAAALAKSVDDVSSDLDADIVLYSGSIDFGCDRRLREKIAINRSKPNVALFLSTDGGTPDVAYKIARYLQDTYSEFYLFVGSRCKSAGTLISIGADHIVLSDMAELGPLDIQIAKPDDLVEYDSGLTPVQALATLRAETFKAFEEFFIDIITRSQGQISTMSAASLALRLTTGCFSKIYQQIPPMKLGEYERAVNITYHYGERLNRGNLQSDALIRLITDYPSHGFVIDRREAVSLFKDVRAPSQKEQTLSYMLSNLSTAFSQQDDRIVIEFMGPGPKISPNTSKRGKGNARKNHKPKSSEAGISERPDLKTPVGPSRKKLVPQSSKKDGTRHPDSRAAKRQDQNGKT